MKIAVDLDNCIDAAPKQFQSMLSAFMAAGHDVTILTGCANDPMTPDDWTEKANYLNSIGCGTCWDDMVILSHANGDLPNLKAKWCDDNSVDLLIDNSKDNARAATSAGIPLVLVPWATRS